MYATTPMIRPIAWTHFDHAAAVGATQGRFKTDGDGGQALAEFAGRACYQSWHRPNPATATNAGYLQHILDVGHLSVLEHGTVTFYMTGVSRSFTHELIRHRHFSYSQLSQRYVGAGGTGTVEPDIIAGDPELHKTFTRAVDAAENAYAELLRRLEVKLAEQQPKVCPECGEHGDPLEGGELPGWACQGGHHFTTPAPMKGRVRTALKKAARQAARSVLPNATETRIVVTGNYRAWRHFIVMRAAVAADVEIREHAVTCLRYLQDIAPAVFADFEIEKLGDGTEIATSPYPF